MAINVKSIVLASKFAIPEMIKTGGGSIINIFVHRRACAPTAARPIPRQKLPSSAA